MNSKLLLLYKLLLSTIALTSLSVIALNQFLNYRNGNVSNTSWQVKEIIYGDRLILASEEKTLEVYLCGIASSSKNEKSKEYLRSLVNKGNLVLDIVKQDDGITVAEAFVQILPDYEREIHVNTEMVTGGMAVLAHPDICPSAEYLEMAAEINQQ